MSSSEPIQMVYAMRFYALVVFCLLMFLSAAGAATLDVLVEGTPVHLPVPTGYCALDTRYSADRLAFQTLYAVMQQQNTNDTLALAVYVNCEQLYSIRDGKNVDEVEYGLYSTPQPIKHVKETRQKFIESTEQELAANWKVANVKLSKLLDDYVPNITSS